MYFFPKRCVFILRHKITIFKVCWCPLDHSITVFRSTAFDWCQYFGKRTINELKRDLGKRPVPVKKCTKNPWRCIFSWRCFLRRGVGAEIKNPPPSDWWFLLPCSHSRLWERSRIQKTWRIWLFLVWNPLEKALGKFFASESHHSQGLYNLNHVFLLWRKNLEKWLHTEGIMAGFNLILHAN